ncbi:MAG: hypothetical protein ACI4F3_09435 [Enterocloster sp.]
MNLKRYSELRKKFPLPEYMESAGNAADPATGHVLSVGIMTRRKLYSEVGYICDADAPEELHACVCSMLEQIKGQAIIKTVLLTPRMIYEPVCGGEKPTEQLMHYADMALCALNQAFKGYLSNEREEK